MKRFAKDAIKVKKVSQAISDIHGVKDRETGKEGIIFRIESIKWLNANKIEVKYGHYENLLGASGDTIVFELIDGKWEHRSISGWIS